jgi:uncharacterized MAPEG superfamily protein
MADPAIPRARTRLGIRFVLFAAVVLMLHLTGYSRPLSQWGAYAWIASRVAYLFAYWSGVPWVRTVCWQVAMIGLVLMMVALCL